MGCPMADRSPAEEVATEYPYQSLYRPWSWVISSLFNIIIVIILVSIAYLYYRRRNNVQRSYVTYRTMNVCAFESQENKKVALVIGGNGGLGRELVNALVNDGSYLVHSLDLFLPDERRKNEGVSTYIQTDITNNEDLSIPFRGVDVVFHCAGLIPRNVRFMSSDFHRVNVEGTKNVLDACVECGVKRLIYTSSASVTLSKNPNSVSEDCDESCPIPSNPINSYIASKGAADKLIRDANGKEGLQTCVVRPNGFVEDMYRALERNLVKMKGYNIEVSVVSISSAVQAHMLAEKKLLEEGKSATIAGKAYNIGEEKASIHDIADFIADEKNVSVISIHISLARFLARVNEVVYSLTGLVAISEFLISSNLNMKTHTYVCRRARQDLGWVQGPSWREVIRGLIKKDQNKKDQ